jgi:putative oxidoreductase
MKKSAIFWRLLAVAVGGLFIYAGALKAWNPAAFATDVFHYRIVPWEVSAAVALYLPWLEIVCGLGLVFRRAVPGSLAILSGLMLVFVGATAAAKLRGIDISCGCFGSSGHSTGFAEILLRDASILLALAFLYWEDARRTASDLKPGHA